MKIKLIAKLNAKTGWGQKKEKEEKKGSRSQPPAQTTARVKHFPA